LKGTTTPKTSTRKILEMRNERKKTKKECERTGK
jgi:hypothetical protein